MLATIEALQPKDFDEVSDLIDRCMRPEATLSMTEDFPLLVGQGAKSRRLVVKDEGRIVSHVAVRLATIRTSQNNGLIQCANFGAVCTDPDARGRGFAASLMRMQLTEARLAGVELAMLWSEVEGFYERLGFHYAGVESRYLVRYADLLGVTPIAARWHRSHDVDALMGLRAEDPCPVARPQAEAQVLFRLPKSKTLVAEEGQSIAAYVTLGKGLDFEGAVCEWGGNFGTVLSLLRILMSAEGLDSVLLLGPQWHKEYNSSLLRLGCTQEIGDMGMFQVLNPAALRRAVDPADALDLPWDSEQLLFRLIGSATGSQQEVTLPLYIWGLDSM